MNIYHFEITPGDQTLLESLARENSELQNHTIKYIAEPITRDSFRSVGDATIVSVFVNSKVDQRVIDSFPNLKLLITRSTGFDHIDVEYALSKGIIVSNIPSYGSRTVAEFTFALMLGLARKTYHAIEQVKEKNDWNMSQFEGFNLQGKTLGIIGTGKIGANVAQIAKGFDMQILANDAFPNEQRAKELGFSYVPLNELLSNSDIVTVHVPATPETHHLINTTNIQRMKRGSLLINTSRGDVIDSAAILIGLEQEILAGVGLDVLEGEHELKEEAHLMSVNRVNQDQLKVLLEDHMLMNNPKVIITPHIAFNAKEATREIIQTTMQNISSFLAGAPTNVITLNHHE